MNIAQELVETGHEVFVIVPEHRTVEGYLFPVRTIIFNNGENKNPIVDFNFPCFTPHPLSNVVYEELTDFQIQAYVQAWRQVVNNAVAELRPDIIHSHHIWVASHVAYETGLPYLIHCHGTDLIGFRKARRYREMAITAAQNAYGIIAVSRHMKAEAIKTYHLPEDKVHLIWNGFDAECFRVILDITTEEVKTEFGLIEVDKPLICFVSRLVEAKGIDILLRAAAIYEKVLSGVQTVLVGYGDLWDELHKLRQELDLVGVHFLGQLPQLEIARILNVSDLLVMPSRDEAFGLAALEAMACGVPVVATNVGGLPDFVNEKVGTLVPIDDPESLAAAIITEIKNGTKKTKGVFASQYALKNFTWARQVIEMTKLYENALSL
ncbi:MAG: glycosyltransferase family 4 protein [Deltaproteobacteria bacterium]|nr:glycosyltransferase family 4 protein [Deltaproteobacteria bacterium]